MGLYDRRVMVRWCRLRFPLTLSLAASFVLMSAQAPVAADKQSPGAGAIAVTKAAPSPSLATAPSTRASSAPVKAEQPAQATALPDDRAVIGFLSQVLSWYRWIDRESAWVQEPAELLFFSDDKQYGEQVVKLAFDYANGQAAVIAARKSAAAMPAAAAQSNSTDTDVLRAQANVQRLEVAVAKAVRRERDQLGQQLAAAHGELELARTRAYFADTMSRFESESQTSGNRLADQIGELRKSVEPAPRNANQLAAASDASVTQLRSVRPAAGILSNASSGLDLRSKAFEISRRADYTRQMLHAFDATDSIFDLRIGELEMQARTIAAQAAAERVSEPALIAQRKQQFEQIIAERKLLTNAALSLEKAEVLLKRYVSNLEQWRSAVTQREYSMFRSLASRLVALGLTLAGVFGAGWLWRRLTFHYVQDVQRRQLILKLRGFVIGTLFVTILLLTFVSELGSLATVIGFGAAGIAVALQDVILSVAGYFRVSGRFGIKVGDWVEVQSVHGQVVDIGLTKLTLVELDSEGGERGATGRIVVLPNSVVFREKFINRSYGSYFTWAELRLTIAPECDYRLAEKRIVDVIDEVFAKYREIARRESQEIERRLNMHVDTPRPHSRIRLTNGGIEITVRYPVDARRQSSVADEISRRLLDSLSREPGLRLVPQGIPSIQAAPITPPAAEPGTIVVETPPEPLVRRAKT